MKKLKLSKIALYISSVITILIVTAYVYENLMIFKIFFNDAASIGIIGCADGPTSIYVSSKMGGLSLEILILIFVLITAILFLLNRALKKNK